MTLVQQHTYFKALSLIIVSITSVRRSDAPRKQSLKNGMFISQSKMIDDVFCIRQIPEQTKAKTEYVNDVRKDGVRIGEWVTGTTTEKMDQRCSPG